MSQDFIENEIKTKKQNIALSTANIKIDDRIIKYEEISDSYLKRNNFILILKSNEKIIVKFNSRQLDIFLDLKKTVDKLAEIGINQPKTCRTEIINTSSIHNSLTIFIVGALMGFQIILGIGLLFTPVGVFLFIPLVGLAVAVIFITFRQSFNAIEGACPLCGTHFKTNRHEKNFKCKTCLRTILIKRDYYEIEVSDSYFDDFFDEDDGFDQFY